MPVSKSLYNWALWGVLVDIIIATWNLPFEIKLLGLTCMDGLVIKYN